MSISNVEKLKRTFSKEENSVVSKITIRRRDDRKVPTQVAAVATAENKPSSPVRKTEGQ